MKVKNDYLRIPYKRLYARDQAMVLQSLAKLLPFEQYMIKKVLRETNPIIWVAYTSMKVDVKTKERIELEVAHSDHQKYP